jgi:drug/metabolite transporter superfamily protein YnfA
MSDFVSSITMLAAFALLAGAFYLWRKQKAAKQALLMALLAFVMLANVVIWTIPEPVPPAGSAATDSATG